MDPPASKLRGPIFVGGTGRSGTTVFARLLGEHPGIFSLRWESQFIVARHGLLDLVDSGFDGEQLEKFLGLMRGRWFRRTLNKGKSNEYTAGLGEDVSLDRLERSISELERRARQGESDDPGHIAAGFANAIFEEPALRTGASRWCEKTPRNSIYMDRLSQLFPHARFVNVIRDGRDVACSMVERGFWPIGATHDYPSTNRFRGAVTFEKAIEYWVEMVSLGSEVGSRLAPGRYLEVRLEDLVEDQEGTARRVLDFLGAAFDRSMVDFHMRDTSLRRWKRDLTPAQVAIADEKAGEVLERHGYPTAA